MKIIKKRKKLAKKLKLRLHMKSLNYQKKLKIMLKYQAQDQVQNKKIRKRNRLKLPKRLNVLNQIMLIVLLIKIADIHSHTKI